MVWAAAEIAIDIRIAVVNNEARSSQTPPPLTSLHAPIWSFNSMAATEGYNESLCLGNDARSARDVNFPHTDLVTPAPASTITNMSLKRAMPKTPDQDV